jgi:hypothetical protein
MIPEGYDDGFPCDDCGAWLEFGRERESHNHDCRLLGAAVTKLLDRQGNVTLAEMGIGTALRLMKSAELALFGRPDLVGDVVDTYL